MKATIGRIVHYYEGDWEAVAASFPGAMNGSWDVLKKAVDRIGKDARGTNGSRFHPAMITQVWSDDCVNLVVFFDAKGVEVRTSATRLPDEAFAEGLHCTNSGWRWPPR